MPIRIGKKVLSLGHKDGKEKKRECKTDASASAIVSRKSLKDAFAAQNPYDDGDDNFFDGVATEGNQYDRTV